jgi:hypothetical protein
MLPNHKRLESWRGRKRRQKYPILERLKASLWCFMWDLCRVATITVVLCAHHNHILERAHQNWSILQISLLYFSKSWRFAKDQEAIRKRNSRHLLFCKDDSLSLVSHSFPPTPCFFYIPIQQKRTGKVFIAVSRWMSCNNRVLVREQVRGKKLWSKIPFFDILFDISKLICSPIFCLSSIENSSVLQIHHPIFHKQIVPSRKCVGPLKATFQYFKRWMRCYTIAFHSVLYHCGEVVCWAKHYIEKPKLRIPFSSSMWMLVCLPWSQQQCVLVIDCCYKTIKFCKTSFFIRIPFKSDFECYTCLLTPFIMYFICNSTFVILEDLGVWRDGLGSKLGFLNKAKCGRRWGLGLS